MVETAFKTRGIVTINTYESGTKNLIDTYRDKNTVTIEGVTELLDRVLNTGTDDSIVTRMVLGDDSGTGTLLSPSVATPTLTSNDQNVVYEIRDQDISISRSGARRLVASVMIEGSDIMNSQFPEDIVLNFCSSTLRFENGTTLAYKRFPVRTLSRLVDITITWELEIIV